MTLRTVLLSLQALLAAAEPDDPQDAVVAYQYKDKYQLFVTTARHWTNVYAGGLLLSFYYGFQAKKCIMWYTLLALGTSTSISTHY